MMKITGAEASRIIALGAALTALAFAVHAQSGPGSSVAAYPTKPIRLVVSVQPGGNLDLVGRAVAEKVSEGLGQRMFVENRPGAEQHRSVLPMSRERCRRLHDGDGRAKRAHRAAHDAHAALRSGTRFRRCEPDRNAAAMLGRASFIAGKTSRISSHSRSRTRRVERGSSGNGSGSHLALELFSKMAGVNMARIPYNGDGPAIIDLLGGHAPVKFDNLSTSLPHVRSGKLRALGITSPTRTALLPEVPAISETVPGFQASIFNGMMAPAGHAARNTVPRACGNREVRADAGDSRALRESGRRAAGERLPRCVHCLSQGGVHAAGRK